MACRDGITADELLAVALQAVDLAVKVLQDANGYGRLSAKR